MIKLYIPDQEKIKEQYEFLQSGGTQVVFPYWAKLWPSAKALVSFLNEHREIITDKTVLELGAGLGLPSIFAGFFAQNIICTDQDPDAIIIAEKSALLNRVNNFSTAGFDWTEFEKIPEAEIIIASDICYDPRQLDAIGLLFDKQLKQGKTIVMSTPPRLSSRDFIISLEPWIKQQSQYTINDSEIPEEISVFVLGI